MSSKFATDDYRESVECHSTIEQHLKYWDPRILQDRKGTKFDVFDSKDSPDEEAYDAISDRAETRRGDCIFDRP